MKRKTCDSFVCEGCGEHIVKAPKFDNRTRYCSKTCKLRAWSKRQVWRCELCGDECQGSPFAQQGRCSQCRKRMKDLAKRAEIVSCAVCGAFYYRNGRKTCSPDCRAEQQGRQMRGRRLVLKYQQKACVDCGATFMISRKPVERCSRCRTRMSGKGGSNHRKRARSRGVAYELSVTPLRVFKRDNWTCQLCGCATPGRLKGTNNDNAPELDHIVPLSRGGGHTWDNVQCACRMCNCLKGDKLLKDFKLWVGALHI